MNLAPVAGYGAQGSFSIGWAIGLTNNILLWYPQFGGVQEIK